MYLGIEAGSVRNRSTAGFLYSSAAIGGTENFKLYDRNSYLVKPEIKSFKSLIRSLLLPDEGFLGSLLFEDERVAPPLDASRSLGVIESAIKYAIQLNGNRHVTADVESSADGDTFHKLARPDAIRIDPVEIVGTDLWSQTKKIIDEPFNRVRRRRARLRPSQAEVNPILLLPF